MAFVRRRRFTRVSVVAEGESAGRCYYARWTAVKGPLSPIFGWDDERGRRHRETFIMIM